MRLRTLLLAASLLAGCTGTDAADAATTTSAAIPPLAVPAWDGLEVETICLAGTEIHEEVPKTPIMDAVAAAIDGDRGDEVAARVGSGSCDVTVTFDVRGRALARGYTGGAMYTGAEIEGTMTLTAPGREPMSVPLANRIDPPESFLLPEWKEPPGEPADAPFWRAVEDAVCGAFAGWFEGADLIPLLMQIRGAWPPRGEECGGYGESSSPFGDLGS